MLEHVHLKTKEPSKQQSTSVVLNETSRLNQNSHKIDQPATQSKFYKITPETEEKNSKNKAIT